MRPSLFSLFGVALLVAACLSPIGDALARHRNHESAGAPGDFAYYVLSLSWSPAFCLASPAAAECNGPRRYGLQGIADLMPARDLVYHEWSAHGTCSGLDPAEFFALVRRAYASIVIPQDLSGPARAIEEPPTAIADDFLRSNPRLAAPSIVVTCTGQSAPRLREVRICFDRELRPRACSADAARGACGAPQIIIPPIR